MDNRKFIARYVAPSAIFGVAFGLAITGVSSQAHAQREGTNNECGADVDCPVAGTIHTTDDDDSFGREEVENGNTFTLSVDEFDRAAIAGTHGVDESDIHLLKAELQLSLTINEWTLGVQDVTAQSGCMFDWDWSLNLKINSNPQVGTLPISTPPLAFDIDVGQINMGDTYDWNAETNGDPLNHGNLGNNPTFSDCYAAVTDLEDWFGTGELDFEVEVVSINTLNGCANAERPTTLLASAEVEVIYTYCVGEEIVVEGCECDRPSPHYRRPGSLLLFPEFDTRQGEYTVLTVTNTDCLSDVDGDCFDEAPENIAVEFVFVDGDNCQENNVTKFLTPCDTLTLIAKHVNPTPEQGYVFAFAKEYDGGLPNGSPISYNYLIGNEMIISGFNFFDYSMNPVAFRSFQDPGCLTDIDGDGYRDLDNVEYQPAPNIITIPRFFGQDGDLGDEVPGVWNSELILIALSGGQQFDTIVDFVFYNDNEEINSSEWTFHCWDKPYLFEISDGFRNQYLKDFTDHDTREIFGATDRETGWICIEGAGAFSDQDNIETPAIYAALVEHVGPLGIADLPFECGIRTNGALIPRGQFGDPDEDVNGDGVVDDEDGVFEDNQ